MTYLLKDKVNSLPKIPGVYIFKNNISEVIYVGKAINLRYRVGSYFIKKHDSDSKTALLVSNINSIDYIPTQSEIEALILEAELIKKHQPKFNIMLKDDKSYLFIVIRKEKDKFLRNIPKVITARKPDLIKDDIYFGPYPDGTTAKNLLRAIRRIFPFRDCSISKFQKYTKLNAPCLYGHLRLCTAPCLKDSQINEYKKNVANLKRFLQGGGTNVYKNYKALMKKAAKETDYEDAAYYRDLLSNIDYVRNNFKNAQGYIDNPNLLHDIEQKSVILIKAHISILRSIPSRIECYDISNISGKEAVGSMVAAIDGRVDKSLYKRFKIKTKDESDDFFMMSEVLERRLKRGVYAQNEKWFLPDLIIIDGGKGQISSVDKIMKKLNINIPIVGITKKNEDIIYKINNKYVSKSISRDDLGLKLIINLRNEAHRFAKKYHTSLRLKKIKV